MKMKVYKEESFKTSTWSGGDMTQLAIYPENADYINRDFIWRLSTSDAKAEESSLARLEDFERILMVLDGSTILSHGDERTVKLDKWQQDAFDGGVKTKCFGAFGKEYSLIMKKGCQGSMELLELEGQGLARKLEGSGSMGIYVAEGYAVVNIKGDSKMVNAGQQMIIEVEPSDVAEITVMGEGKSIFTSISYDIEEFIMPEIPVEKASGSDFKTAFKLYTKNNKWSNLFNSQKKNGVWKSPALEKKMKKLDRWSITTIVWCIELVLSFATISIGVDTSIACILAAAITILHVLVIGPMIYFIMLPKPISAHMKKVEDLNPAEMKDYLRQINENERLDRLMAKYQSKDGDYFSDDNSFLNRFKMKR